MINVTYTNDLGITNELVDANTTLRAFAEAHHIATAGRSILANGFPANDLNATIGSLAGDSDALELVSTTKLDSAC